MCSDLELDKVLVAAISGIPKVAELIALIPAEHQLLALKAAEELSADCAQSWIRGS